jgi:glycosyltransferase involved in cell wall biosynthesis
MLAQFFRPDIGGEERSVEDLAAALVARGHDVAVATLRLPGTPAREQLDGVRVHRLEGLVNRLGILFRDDARRHLPPLPDPELVVALARVLSEERPDVVHAHNWIVHSFLPLKRRTWAPLVLSLHDYSLVCATKRLIRFGSICDGPGAAKCLRCGVGHYGVAKGAFIASAVQATGPFLRRGVDMYVPVSRSVAERLSLARRGLRYEVLPNLLAAPRQGPPAEVDPELIAKLPAGDFVLFLGDATVDKGALLLAQAHRMLDRPPPLVFVGRTIDIGGIRREGDVRVLGPWPHPAALEAVRRCTLLVVPSIVPETFGIAALEAMGMGKPVIASNIGGLPELVVDGETGRLVPPGDPAALRDALRDMLADRKGLEAMGEAARVRADLYRAEAVVPRFEAVYRSLTPIGTPELEPALGHA